MKRDDSKMNPFAVLQNVQNAYRTYVHTFQRFKNPVIHDWVIDKVERGTLLWKDPYIQLNRRFKKGEALEELVKKGILHAGVLNCFTEEQGNRKAPAISPYQHQSSAVRHLLEGEANIIVATGTGSGKSFCFGIPIIHECLRLKDQAVRGIKAVIIYPMNALANSQYDDFAKRLAGSGLKIGLYTGDTDTSNEDALDNYRKTFDREPLDSEIISRDQIRDTLPDILMTNYVQLELLLTRFDDKKLFPPENAGVLKFLVLDEVHTYSGKQGADVACLIRRLKQHTGTMGKLRCIGTSATVQSDEGEDAEKEIAAFAEKLFGEPFTRQTVIGEEYRVGSVSSQSSLFLTYPAGCSH